jgi:hypothetical protein
LKITCAAERTSAEVKNRLQFVNEQLPKIRADLERARALTVPAPEPIDISQQTGAILAQTTATPLASRS